MSAECLFRLRKFWHFAYLDLKKELKQHQEQRKALTVGVQKLSTLKKIEMIIGGLNNNFEDAISRLYTAQGIWRAVY